MPGPGNPPEATVDLAEAQSCLEQFLAAQSSLVLAVRAEGEPLPIIASLPFALHEGRFFVLASELALHTAPLMEEGRARIALLADQSTTRNPFARERAQWAATVESVSRDSEPFKAAIQTLRERHGKTVDLLCGLGDFHLLAFRPGDGRYVSGFGRAFGLDGLSIADHLQG
ncbi:hypothetical protein P8631_04215 [Guyparkeria sp. 1SP6A2]|nr:hypothetical protein [Guyparkeria sp. 1SP6A2]